MGDAEWNTRRSGETVREGGVTPGERESEYGEVEVGGVIIRFGPPIVISGECECWSQE